MKQFFYSNNALLSLIIFIVLLVISYSANAIDLDVDIGIKIGSDGKVRIQDSPKHESSKHKGPPGHAPAHGYRAKHKYHYYPSSQIYFDSGRGLYFYLSGSNWRMSASLPMDLKVRLGSYVSIEMESEKPYVQHASHKAKYPPGQLKKKMKRNSHKHKDHKKNKNK